VFMENSFVLQDDVSGVITAFFPGILR